MDYKQQGKHKTAENDLFWLIDRVLPGRGGRRQAGTMLPQYVIMLGARTQWRSAAGKAGKFEERDYEAIERIVRVEHGFGGCTIVPAQGFFKGREEDMVQIIILEENYEKIRVCAQQLRRAFKQKTVLVVSAGVGEFLT